MRVFVGRLIIAAVVILMAWLVWVIVVPVRLPTVPYPITVEANRTLSQVAQQFVDQKLIRHRSIMVALARLVGVDRKLKAGRYLFYHSVSMLDVLRRFIEGKPDQASVMLLEGWSFRQVRQALAKSPHLQPLTAQWTEAQILAAIGSSATHAEGLLFPSTYFFTPQSSDLSIFKRALETMQQKLAAVWATRAMGLPYRTPYEMLIMASLIEKETARDEDRSLIAAVFVNRLKIGMRLQTDPAVIYGLGAAFDGNLRKLDLQRDTPFNTYTRNGLPPTPIAMPGKAALDAVAHPARSKALYFVAKGDTGSYFSNTLNEHNRAVRRYILKKGP